MFDRLRSLFTSPAPEEAEPHCLRSTDDLEHALELSSERPVALYKHSVTCGTSYWARRQIRRLTAPKDPPVFEVVVQESRPVSDLIAERLGIRHASPQLILLRHRKPVWNASHGAIDAEALRAAVRNLKT